MATDSHAMTRMNVRTELMDATLTLLVPTLSEATRVLAAVVTVATGSVVLISMSVLVPKLIIALMMPPAPTPMEVTLVLVTMVSAATV